MKAILIYKSSIHGGILLLKLTCLSFGSQSNGLIMIGYGLLQISGTNPLFVFHTISLTMSSRAL